MTADPFTSGRHPRPTLRDTTSAAPGTIGRPAPHGPLRVPRGQTTEPPARTHPAAVQPHQKQNRTRQLQLIPEVLARSRMRERAQEAESQRTANRHAVALRLQRRSLRLQRRAERASQRARRAVAIAVMQ